jgi:hypothetical protein
MIELMKLDKDFTDYHEGVDMSVTLEVRESYDAAPERFLPRLIAERAKLFCRKKMGIEFEEFDVNWKRWRDILLVFTGLSFLCVAIVTALGTPWIFFSVEKREASVLAVSVLIGWMSLRCLIPIISLFSLIWQRWNERPQAKVADLILWIIGTARDGYASLRGLPLPSRRATPDRFAELFRQSSYFASASSIFLSNLYFVLMAIAIWGVLWLFLFSRNVNYVYESSLRTAEERASFIEAAGRPVTFVTGTPAPGPAEIRWAGGSFVFDEKSFVHENNGETKPWSKDEIETHKSRTFDGFRRIWSRFLLSSVWTWVFLPRAAVAIAAGVCMVWFKRDFLPTHKELTSRELVKNIRNRRSHVEEVSIEQVDETVANLIVSEQYAQLSQNIRLVTAESEASSSVPVIRNEMSTFEKLERAEKFGILGFGLGSSVSDSTTRLAKLEIGCHDYGNLNGAKPQFRFRAFWKGDDCPNISLVILASLTSVPTGSFGEFLSDLVVSARSKPTATPSTIQIILTDGIATRERLGGDPDVFETRVGQWIGRIVEAGVNKSNIFEFDITTDAGALAAWKALKPNSPQDRSERLQIAGKTYDAVGIVLRYFSAVFSSEISTHDHDWTEQLTLISNDLGKLYCDESRDLSQFLDRKKCSDSIRAAINNCELPNGIMPEQLQKLAKWMELLETVSPKWIGAGALGGIGLGAVVGASIVATGGFAAIPLSLFTVIASPFGGAVVGQVAKILCFPKLPPNNLNDHAPSTVNIVLAEAEQTLQASILQIIVLELQGNSESDITKQLREQTRRLDHHQVKNMKDIEAMLSDFQTGMSTIGGQS